jgi:hypothetical protein
MKHENSETSNREHITFPSFFSQVLQTGAEKLNWFWSFFPRLIMGKHFQSVTYTCKTFAVNKWYLPFWQFWLKFVERFHNFGAVWSVQEDLMPPLLFSCGTWPALSVWLKPTHSSLLNLDVPSTKTSACVFAALCSLSA